MKIKTKLLFTIGGSLVLLLAICFEVLILLTSTAITERLNFQLDNQVENVTAQVSNLIATSARSYLSAIGEKSNSISNGYYKSYELGELTYEEAFEKSLNSIIEFNFLKSGIVFVTDQEGIIISHSNSEKNNTIAPIQAWIQRQKPDDTSFKTYEFQSKNKIVFRIYNKHFDYNICVDVNTSEFFDVVDIGELNKIINNIKVGITGYPFIMSKSGNVVTHPDKLKINTYLLDETDDTGFPIYQKILEQKNGSIQYQLSDKYGFKTDKFLTYRTEKNTDLIICLSGSVSEFYNTVAIIKGGISVLGVIALIIFSVIIFIVSSTITIPINNLIKNLDDVVNGNGDLTRRISLKSRDEIGDLVKLFNNFLDTIQNLIIKIKVAAQTSSNVKNHFIYRINETTASVKKILVNIISIKNQTKQLDEKVENSIKIAALIRNHAKQLNLSILKQQKVTKSSIEGSSLILLYFNEISALIEFFKDNTQIPNPKDDDSVIFFNKNIKSIDRIMSKIKEIEKKNVEVLNSINLLKEVSIEIEGISKTIYKESDKVSVTVSETKHISSYVVDSMNKIIHSTTKISNSMEKLSNNILELEDSSEILHSSINIFET